jgi:hypothetical protein
VVNGVEEVHHRRAQRQHRHAAGADAVRDMMRSAPAFLSLASASLLNTASMTGRRSWRADSVM